MISALDWGTCLILNQRSYKSEKHWGDESTKTTDDTIHVLCKVKG